MCDLADTGNGTEAAMVGPPGGCLAIVCAFAGERGMSETQPKRSVGADQRLIGKVGVISPVLVLVRALMLRTRQTRQVLKAVVISNVIQVVNMVIGRYWPIGLFPDKDMFGSIPIAANPDENIAVLSERSALPPRGAATFEATCVMAVDKAQRIPDVLSTPTIGGCRNRGRFSASALTESRRRYPISRGERSCASLHLLETVRSGPVALNETGTPIRVLSTARRQGESTSTGAYLHILSITGRKVGVNCGYSPGA